MSGKNAYCKNLMSRVISMEEGAEVMAQQLRVFIDLAENPGWVLAST